MNKFALVATAAFLAFVSGVVMQKQFAQMFVVKRDTTVAEPAVLVPNSIRGRLSRLLRQAPEVTIGVTKPAWVSVQNVKPINRGMGQWTLYGDQCVIGPILEQELATYHFTVARRRGENGAALYEYRTNRPPSMGTPCPDGTLFFLPEGEVSL